MQSPAPPPQSGFRRMRPFFILFGLLFLILIALAVFALAA